MWELKDRKTGFVVRAVRMVLAVALFAVILPIAAFGQ